jgi:hypothetical protein
MSVPVNSTAIQLGSVNLDFTTSHIRISGIQSAATLHGPGFALLPLVIADMFHKAHSIRGPALRDAALETLLLFPTLVIGPQRPSASSSSVKTEVTPRLDLWWRGEL